VEGVEYESYLFGVKLTARLRQMELFLGEKFPTGLTEPLKHAFNREMGKAFEARVGHGTLDLTHPHLSFIIDLKRDKIELRVLSLYIYGRALSQTRTRDSTNPLAVPALPGEGL
jgi:tRNA U54 and U55 pseudouridine synthase Pus10